jgi:hypothetical protein
MVMVWHRFLVVLFLLLLLDVPLLAVVEGPNCV